jgi:Domain of unknown function (DUF5925)/ATPase family associated with various cellular activities (AAA)
LSPEFKPPKPSYWAGDPFDAAWRAALIEHGLHHSQQLGWPTDADQLELDKTIVCHREPERLHAVGWLGEVLVGVYVSQGNALIWVGAKRPQALEAALEELRLRLPLAEAGEEQAVDFTFWHHTSQGPQSSRRRLEVPNWEEIAANYAAETAERLGAMYELKEPQGGKLYIWHGPAGTGKTWALRALAWEWREWCQCHYLIDPEKFFGDHPGDLMQVALQGEDSKADEDAPGQAAKRWKLLILEDTGELVAPDAKEHTGQALSRLLNLVDGLIGQGLHVMALITTNEELSKLHPAITRHGRCGLEIRFDPLSPAEARSWLRAHDQEQEFPPSGALTLADLYATLQQWTPGVRKSARVGFQVVR